MTPESEIEIKREELRRVISCFIPAGILEKLKLEGGKLHETVGLALIAGKSYLETEENIHGTVSWQGLKLNRPVSTNIPISTYERIEALAKDKFGGNLKEAFAWMVIRGLGVRLSLPSANPSEPAPVVPRKPPTPPARTWKPALVEAEPLVKPETKAQKSEKARPTRAQTPSIIPTPLDYIPTGIELRAGRDELGLTQRDLAVATGLSRGLVAEIESGRRTALLTRLRISETIKALKRAR